MTLKRCIKCDKEKELREFQEDLRQKDKLSKRCATCTPELTPKYKARKENDKKTDRVNLQTLKSNVAIGLTEHRKKEFAQLKVGDEFLGKKILSRTEYLLILEGKNTYTLNDYISDRKEF